MRVRCEHCENEFIPHWEDEDRFICRTCMLERKDHICAGANCERWIPRGEEAARKEVPDHRYQLYAYLCPVCADLMVEEHGELIDGFEWVEEEEEV